MRTSLRLGRIAGIPVRVNWSVLVILALMAWGLAAGRFPATYPGQTTWAYAVAGVGAATAFFLGLLAHEVSHGVVARRNQLPVEEIVLWLFGGMARLRGEPADPGTELRVAAAGPVMSLALALVFGSIAVAVGLLSSVGLLTGVLGWLAAINLALTLFNIIPAAPLDGGRLLRAGLWRWRGDKTGAALMSARTGQALGWILIALGASEALTGAVLGGVWLAVLGWFLAMAAGAEARQATVARALVGTRVGDVMSPHPYAVAASTTVDGLMHEYLFRAFRNRLSTIPLLEGERPVGLVTLDSIEHVNPSQRPTVRLIDIACPLPDVPVATPDDDVSALLPRLGGCAGDRVLVVGADGRLLGLLTPPDIARITHGRFQRERPYDHAA